MNKSELVSIRDCLPEDKNLIFASWLKGLYYGDTWYSKMNKNTFMENYHRVIDFILNKNTTTIKIACLKEDPSVILGYAVLTKGAVHWVFVKKSWRNIGIAKDLIPKDVKIATHLNKIGVSIIKNKGWEFNPFII